MAYQVLVVDDDGALRKVFSTYLGEYYDVIEAANGSDALDLLKKPNQIDVIILDVMMPGKQGTEVLKEIKKIAPDVRVVMSTAYSTKEVMVASLRGHADDFIEKPFNVGKVKGIIEGLLRGKNGAGNMDACDTRDKIEKVKRFVERNLEKNVSLKDVASAVCLSPKYLSRVFKQKTGDSFCRYKAGVKMEKAKELLVGSGYNVNQISEKLGYQNVESFIRVFEKIVHCTPSKYRNRKEQVRYQPVVKSQ